MKHSYTHKARLFAIVALVFILLTSTLLAGCSAQASYNRKVEKAYNELIEAFTEKLVDDLPNGEAFSDYQITYITFNVEDKNDLLVDEINLKIFATCKDSYDQTAYLDVVYSLKEQYYYNLMKKEESGDVLEYIEALDICFANMRYTYRDINGLNPNFELYKSQTEEFNNLFVPQDNNLTQVGYLPIRLAGSHCEYLPNNKAILTYNLTGISFIEVAEGTGDGVLPDDDNFIGNNINKNNVKAYYVDFKYVIEVDSTDMDYVFSHSCFEVVQNYLNGTDTSSLISVENVFLKEIETDILFKMQNGIFDFEKPAE